jgi:M6 family metalloprotease-like protein
VRNLRFVLIILVITCGLITLGPVRSAGSTPAPATEAVNAPTRTSVPEWIIPAAQPTSTPDPTTACKLRLPPAVNDVGLGFPRLRHRMPSVGNVRTVVLFADFRDVPGAQTPAPGSQTAQELFDVISPEAENFFHDISYGRLTWTLVPHFPWLRLSRTSTDYAAAPDSFDGHRNFIQEAVNLAVAQNVDFSTADSVVVMIPSRTTAVRNGPAFTAPAGQGFTAGGRTIDNGVTSGADLPRWGFRWLNHESGHTMGLPDLYAFQSANEGDRHRFVGGFGMMGRIDGNAPEYFAFERWQLGWLDDTQIVCLPSGGDTVTLSAIESMGGTKAVIVPLSDSRAVVVESRRRLGHDTNLVNEGPLVYIVDTSLRNGGGPLVIHPVLPNDPNRDRSPLRVGQSLTLEGVTITSLSHREDGDAVRVERTPITAAGNKNGVSREPAQLDVFWVAPDGAIRSQWWRAGAADGAWAEHEPFNIAPPGSAG